MKNFVDVESLETGQVLDLIKRAIWLKENGVTQLDKQIFAANLFFEASTRTHKSFEVAQKKLGMEVINFNEDASSVKKGETLYDTVLTMSAIDIDICVVRHGQVKYYEELIASDTIKCSIINGGDGSGEHPTQCLLDLMTIYEEFGTFEGLKVVIVGDLKHSRVAKSNMKMLNRLGADVYFSSPEDLYTDEFEGYGTYLPLDEIVDTADVVMLLRVQLERHENENAIAHDFLNEYGLNKERYNRLKDTSIVMHPAPVNRGVEIDDSLVEAPKSRIVEQMNNGVYSRVAVLEAIVKGRENG